MMFFFRSFRFLRAPTYTLGVRVCREEMMRRRAGSPERRVVAVVACAMALQWLSLASPLPTAHAATATRKGDVDVSATTLCSAMNCANGGVCSVKNGVATCHCADGWVGATCATSWADHLKSGAGDSCTGLTSCGTCSTAPGCGWCEFSKTCMGGGQYGPYNGAACEAWWVPPNGACTSDHCRTSRGCSDCLTIHADCGWCGSMSRCANAACLSCAHRIPCRRSFGCTPRSVFRV